MEKFSTSITGYKKEEVNKFIDDVIKQVESMINKSTNSRHQAQRSVLYNKSQLIK